MTAQHPPDQRCVFCATAERMWSGRLVDCPASECPHWPAIEADPSVRQRLVLDERRDRR